MRYTAHVPKQPTQPLLNVDEWCWYGGEFDKDKPMWGPHRYQMLLVRRGQIEYTFVQDLGPSLLWPRAHPSNFPAMNCYRVGEVMEVLERMREGVPPEGLEPSDIGGQYIKVLEERQAQRAHRTTSGRYITIARR